MAGALQQFLDAMGKGGSGPMGDAPPIEAPANAQNQTGLSRPYDPAAWFYQRAISQIKALAQIVQRLGDDLEATYLEKLAVDLQQHRNKRTQDFIKRNKPPETNMSQPPMGGGYSG